MAVVGRDDVLGDGGKDAEDEDSDRRPYDEADGLGHEVWLCREFCDS
jgi:hypothetical protein